jgi:hypothetical protein
MAHNQVVRDLISAGMIARGWQSRPYAMYEYAFANGDKLRAELKLTRSHLVLPHFGIVNWKVFKRLAQLNKVINRQYATRFGVLPDDTYAICGSPWNMSKDTEHISWHFSLDQDESQIKVKVDDICSVTHASSHNFYSLNDSVKKLIMNLEIERLEGYSNTSYVLPIVISEFGNDNKARQIVVEELNNLRKIKGAKSSEFERYEKFARALVGLSITSIKFASIS